MIQVWIAPMIRPFTTTETNHDQRSGCWDRGVASRQHGVCRRDRSRIQRLAGEADDLPGGERGHDANGPDLARQAILASREDVAGLCGHRRQVSPHWACAQGRRSPAGNTAMVM
jgi:hypothetical protein